MLDDSFAQKLAGWVRAKGEEGRGLRILSSTQPAALAAASAVAGASATVTHQSALNPIFRGAVAPEHKEQLLASMGFHERFAGGGESFGDLVRRR